MCPLGYYQSANGPMVTHVLNQTTKAKLVTMIANSEINETGKILSHPFLVCPVGFLKNQLPPSLLPLFSKFYCPFRGRGIGNYVNL